MSDLVTLESSPETHFYAANITAGNLILTGVVNPYLNTAVSDLSQEEGKSRHRFGVGFLLALKEKIEKEKGFGKGGISRAIETSRWAGISRMKNEQSLSVPVGLGLLYAFMDQSEIHIVGDAVIFGPDGRVLEVVSSGGENVGMLGTSMNDRVQKVTPVSRNREGISAVVFASGITGFVNEVMSLDDLENSLMGHNDSTGYFVYGRFVSQASPRVQPQVIRRASPPAVVQQRPQQTVSAPPLSIPTLQGEDQQVGQERLDGEKRPARAQKGGEEKGRQAERSRPEGSQGSGKKRTIIDRSVLNGGNGVLEVDEEEGVRTPYEMQVYEAERSFLESGDELEVPRSNKAIAYAAGFGVLIALCLMFGEPVRKAGSEILDDILKSLQPNKSQTENNPREVYATAELPELEPTNVPATATPEPPTPTPVIEITVGNLSHYCGNTVGPLKGTNIRSTPYYNDKNPNDPRNNNIVASQPAGVRFREVEGEEIVVVDGFMWRMVYYVKGIDAYGEPILDTGYFRNDGAEACDKIQRNAYNPIKSTNRNSRLVLPDNRRQVRMAMKRIA